MIRPLSLQVWESPRTIVTQMDKSHSQTDRQTHTTTAADGYNTRGNPLQLGTACFTAAPRMEHPLREECVCVGVGLNVKGKRCWRMETCNRPTHTDWSQSRGGGTPALLSDCLQNTTQTKISHLMSLSTRFILFIHTVGWDSVTKTEMSCEYDFQCWVILGLPFYVSLFVLINMNETEFLSPCHVSNILHVWPHRTRVEILWLQRLKISSQTPPT